MDFVQRSDIGTWDWLANGWYLTFFVVSILVCIGLIIGAIVCFADTEESKFLTVTFGLLMLMVGFAIPFITFSMGTATEVNKARQ